MDLIKINKILDELIERYPVLDSSKEDIRTAYYMLCNCYENKQKLLICGNGGSASDSEHIVGELMKSFSVERRLSDDIKKNLEKASSEKGSFIAAKLQPALPAISLTCHSALNTAFANDVDPALIFAQQVLGYGVEGDVLMAISTSGNSENAVDAIITAKALGLKTIGLTGKSGGKFNELCDVVIRVDAEVTPAIQELHLPVYHALCEMIEVKFFSC